MATDNQTRANMYRTMVRSRHLDDRLTEQYWVGKTPIFAFGNGPLPGELHTSHGQEPVAAGLCSVLRPEDAMTAAHRPHHLAVARGVDLKRMAAELFGKKAGLSGGRGGHMHIYDAAVNFSSSGIIAEGLGPAAGMALARRMQGQPGIAVGVIGDAAANQGAFHEVLNLIGIYKLPVVIVIEDNKWGVTTHKSASTAIERNSDRAAGYGLVGEFVAGNDADLIREACLRAVERARSGGGGTLLEIETARLQGHFMGDPSAYITDDRKAYQVDPIPRYREKLIAEGVLSEEQAQQIESEEQALVNEAIAFALDAPYPEPEEALEHVFASH
ncbi:MAG: thiamine pyrophosphate-dependent dehydrogenase E1 component subunit alpha [Porticoccaceae bacterium]